MISARSFWLVMTLLVAALATAAPVLAFQWPLAPQGQPHSIAKTYGDWDGHHSKWGSGAGFHTGVDLSADIGDSVYSVRDGVVTEVTVGAPTGRGFIIVSESMTAERGWLYGHVVTDTSYLSIGDPVVSGQGLVTIDNFNPGGPLDSFDHLHFQNSKSADPVHYLDAYSNPLDSLSPPLTSQTPQVDTLVYWVNPTGPILPRDSLCGDVDIIMVRAWVDIQPAPPDPLWKAGIYKIGYQIADVSDSVVVP